MITSKFYIHYAIIFITSLVLCIGLFGWAKSFFHFKEHVSIVPALVPVVLLALRQKTGNKEISLKKLYMGSLLGCIGGTLVGIVLNIAWP